MAPAPNIWLEFCSTYLATGAIRRGIEAVGADRVLFGSDYPLIALPYMVAAYADAELSRRFDSRPVTARRAGRAPVCTDARKESVDRSGPMS